MLYLSRLIIDPQRREVQRDLGDCYNMHRTLLKAFPQVAEGNAAREQFGLLYRLEEHSGNLMRILVQSQHLPDWQQLPVGYLASTNDGPNPSVRPLDTVYGRISNGMQLRFRLRANPTKRVSARSNQEAKWYGKRIELRDEHQQLAWLARKGEQGGFRLLEAHANQPDVQASNQNKVRGWQRSNQLRFGAVLFEGRLEVLDHTNFLATLTRGIGSGKAFGFGLLSIAQG
jgi:CRISPR system Cascade subunit CasE